MNARSWVRAGIFGGLVTVFLALVGLIGRFVDLNLVGEQITFVIGGILAGIAGILFSMTFGQVQFTMGFRPGIAAFTAAVLGGIGNLSGAVVGALCIAFIEAFNEGLRWNNPLEYLGSASDWTRALVFAVLIAILVFRPEGILGERTPEGA